MKVRGIEMFQSLFFWNHYLDLYPLKQLDYITAVSFLVFLEPLLRPIYRGWNSVNITTFQSLFFWNHYLDETLIKKILLTLTVSILVFLEPLLRQKAIEALDAEYDNFNPCFSGTTT